MSNILVVDDDTDICALIEFKLGQSGHSVTVAHDGEAGLDTARSGEWDLILLDWMMPRRTGPEVCRELRQDDSFADVPVILLTAKAQESDVEHGFAAGADDYMVKPFSPRELSTRVSAALARRRR